jgi:hypothetical protein
MAPVSLSMQTSMSRWRSHSRSGGTISPISNFFGFETIPTFLMIILSCAPPARARLTWHNNLA